MNRLFYPILNFILLQICICVFTVLWIGWFFIEKHEYQKLVQITKISYTNFEHLHMSQSTLFTGIAFFAFVIIVSTFMFIGWVKEKVLAKHRNVFFSAFTHELMTPITCIQMNVESVLYRETLNEEKKKMLLEAAFSEGKRLEGSINKIIAMTRIEYKKTLLNKEMLSVQEFFSSYVETKKEYYPHVHFELNLSDCGKLIMAVDPLYFTIALDNLIENAVKYSKDKDKDKDTTRIQLLLTHKIFPQKLLLEVKDNGVGMEPNRVKKLFQIFYQDRPNSPGNGLGLFIVENVIRLHKGKVWGVSEGVGKGMSFVIQLPYKKVYEKKNFIS